MVPKHQPCPIYLFISFGSSYLTHGELPVVIKPQLVGRCPFLSVSVCSSHIDLALVEHARQSLPQDLCTFCLSGAQLTLLLQSFLMTTFYEILFINITPDTHTDLCFLFFDSLSPGHYTLIRGYNLPRMKAW